MTSQVLIKYKIFKILFINSGMNFTDEIYMDL